MRFTPSQPAPAAADAQRGATRGAVAEIVTFRLADGSDAAAFAEAADDMTPYLKKTGAVLSRTLSVDETGLWTDHVTWTSMTAAKAVAAAIMQQPDAAPFMQMIDPSTVDMRHATIHYGLSPD